ncbi:hypothetical protein EN829_032970 [Mesorhizobium sp. M00.F.Ca.ET.186.01.1.1]|nr:hypothetical protein EN829_032970 [Mesorhizobium sp. M00.F.Ca.ET.186.01.1.1]
MDTEQLLSILTQVFVLEEKAIKKKNSAKYVTNTYENNVRHFAKQLIMSMILSHNDLKENADYKSLLRQRHIAYGFYNILDNGFASGYDILKDPSIEKLLYSGLADFYRNFYGSFSDNEEAIKLLCKFYPKDDSLFGNKENIVNPIFYHISNAGTPSDVGFAFRGIELIRENINNLPIEIIDQLLQKYELYRIINEKVYRHQIFTIIDNASIKMEDERQKYKFSYLDSLLLANSMNNSLYEKYGSQEHLSRHYIHFDQNMKADKIGLIFSNTQESTYAYWTNKCSMDRNFVVNEETAINMRLHIAEKQISLTYLNKPTTQINFEFVYDDWMLDNYRSKETEQTLHKFVHGGSSEKEDFTYNPLTFSLLYLSRYRGLNEQVINFDHQFTYDKKTNELKNSSESPDISHFYGEKLYSLTCIVGKNGTGKTSTVDFLRSTFFRLLNLIANRKITSKKGYVSESDYGVYNIVDSGSKFMVVFHLRNQPYYLTNIKHITTLAAKPFDNNAYKSVHELSKVAYFSNMLSVNQDSLFTDEEMVPRDKSQQEKMAMSLSSFRQANYSEASSFIQKRKAMENDTPSINKDLCYQLAFLDYLSPKKLEAYFDMPSDRTLTVKSELSDLKEIELTVTNIGEKLTSLKPFLTTPDAKLESFSSGQYAKFSFLAKLYWFLEGHRKYTERWKPLIGSYIFSRDEVLQEEETALLFIDEGELYYHPEWQRKYIKMLIDFIHSTDTKFKIQVVITTNSPFIISDILSKDVTYLSSEEKEFDQTFGQNIHKLLIHNFFMSYTIGEYSRELIENIMKWLCPTKDDVVNISEELSLYFERPIDPKDYSEKIRCLINQIGEPIYRDKLLDTLNKSELGKSSELELLLRQRAEIDQRIKSLKEGG